MSMHPTLNIPSFAINGLSSLNTRPSLAVHRDKYDSFPRLFPFQAEAEQLLPPFAVQENRHLRHSPRRGKKKVLYEHVYSKIRHRDNLASTEVLEPSCEQQHESNDFDMDTVIQGLEQSSDASRRLHDQTWNLSMTESVPPLCTTVPFLEEDFLHLHDEQFSASPIPQTCEDWQPPGSGNPIALAAIGKRKAVIFSPTGLLDSITVAEISIQESDGTPSHSFKPLSTSLRPPDFMLLDENPIVDITSSQSSSDIFQRGMVLATTASALSFGTFDDVAFQWNFQFDLGRIVATAFNPVLPEEFALVCDDGVFAGTASTLQNVLFYQKTDQVFADIQPICPKARFRQVHYGAHPRTLLLANPRGICRHDLRAPNANTVRDGVLDIEDHWGLSLKDTEVAFFQPLRQSNAFHIVLATRTALFYVDVRRPHAPLLDWSLSLPSTVDHMAVCEMMASEVNFDVIALSSTRHCYLEMFHGVHLRNDEMFGFDGSQNGKVWRPPLPTCEVLWSDMPLAHLQQLQKPSPTAGLMILPLEKTGTVSLLQWSATEGLIAQLINIKAFQDAGRSFDKLAEAPVRQFDSSILAWKHQQSLAEVGRHTTCKHLKCCALQRSPGLSLLNRLRLLFVKDALDLQERICRTDEDELSFGSVQTRVPRPFLADISFVLQYRAKSVEEPHDKYPKLRKTEEEGRFSSQGACLVSDTHSDRTLSNYSSEMSDPGMGNILCAIGGGMMISEVARHVRSGMAHNATPLGLAGLEDALRYAPLVYSSPVEWHSTCLELHDGCHGHVDSNEEMPDWVTQTVYCVSEVEQGQSRRSSQIPEGSEYGRMLSRMESFFFA